MAIKFYSHKVQAFIGAMNYKRFICNVKLVLHRFWQVPYFWAGIKTYDVIAGKQLLKPSYYLSKRKALELFPMLKKEKLVGALVYYDGEGILLMETYLFCT
mgnify:CR=1 FL=1